MNRSLRYLLNTLLIICIIIAAGAGVLLLASAVFGVSVPEHFLSGNTDSGEGNASGSGSTLVEQFSPDDPYLAAAKEAQRKAAEEAEAAAAQQAAAEEAARQQEEAARAEQERIGSYIPMDGTYSGDITHAGGEFKVRCADADSATMTFAGDILFSSDYATGVQAWSVGIMNCFDEGTTELMRNADVFMLNNEFEYTTGGTAIPNKKYTLRALPETVEWLRDMGVDIVSLANNHMFDFQEEGLADTLETLRGAGIPYVGAGENIDEAATTAYIHLLVPAGNDTGTENNEESENEAGTDEDPLMTDAMTIAILNATRIEQYENPETRAATETESGVFRCFDPALLYEKVAEAKQNADFVIVYVHWGTESTHDIEEHQHELAEGITNAGGDLIVGDHPHVLQGIGTANGKPVAYSLGNYYFTSYTTDTGLLQAVFDPSEKTMKGLRFVPCLQTNASVHLLDGSEKTRVLDEMREYSAATGGSVSIDDDGWVSWED